MFFKRNNITKSMKKFNEFYNEKGLKHSKEIEDLYDKIKEEYKAKISK